MDTIGRAQLETALSALGEVLATRGAHFEVVLVGGGNLILRGLITRPTTRDLDILGAWTPDGIVPIRPMPEPLRDAVVDVGRTFGLASDWLNTGPDSLLDFGLPDGFVERLERRDFGGLVAWLAGWYDMVCFKLYAAVDQGPRSRHFQDLVELRADRDDLLEAARWARATIHRRASVPCSSRRSGHSAWRKPMTGSGSSLVGALLNRAWIQWAALGVDATVERDDAVVDPEALIALTAELGDADARLRDLSTDWCVAYGRYINGSRLKQVVRELGTPGEAIGEYVATVAAAGGPSWPMATQPRPDYVRRAKARMDSATTRPRLRIRLRAAFGVNARADVLAALLAASPHELTAADLARSTRFTKPNVASALDALVLAGLATAHPVANERRFGLPSKVPLLPGLRPPVTQPDWVSRFGVALEVHRFAERDGASTTVRAIEARRLIERLMGRMLAEGMPIPNLDVTGNEFAYAFDRWLVDFVDRLRAASRG